ncbi:MAG: hypothetical protein R3246_12105 [Acidimicrobiia bacterium]|nr:hypothetical protein [Acidimicrobiia bacterium]
MDTTPDAPDRIEHVRTLLDQVAEADPADAIAPLGEIAEILERLLDGDEA